MREGYTKKNPIDVSLFRNLYPGVKLPNNSYVNFRNKLYITKNNKFNIVSIFNNSKRPKSEKPIDKTDMRRLKQQWIKNWKLEIEAQKKRD